MSIDACRPVTGRALRLAVCLSVLAVPLAAFSAALPQYERVRELHNPKSLPDAELIDHTSEPFSLKSLEGSVTLVLFGFTNCPDICPLGMQRMRQLEQSGLLPEGRVKYVLISVDGERDTPEVMAEFVGNYSENIIGLTADPSLVKRVAKAFGASFFKGHAAGHHDDYQVAHSPQIFVTDTEGLIRAELYSASVEASAGIVSALLQSEQEQ